MAAAGIFPLMVPVDEGLTCFRGYITAGDRQYHLRVDGLPMGAASHCDRSSAHSRHGAAKDAGVPGEGGGASTLAERRLEYGDDLAAFLGQYQAIVQQRFEQSTDLAGFFRELRDILDRLVRAHPPQELLPPEFYTRLLQELDALGWDKLVYMHADLTALHLRILDAGQREHIVHVVLLPGYPQVAPVTSAAIASYQELWDTLDDLDQHTWVVEPERPTRCDVYRRIALGGHASLLIHLSTERPRAAPECRFLGSDAAVGRLKDNLHSNAHKWDPAKPVRANLEEVLGTTFPRFERGSEAAEDVSTECGICYSYRLLPPTTGVSAAEATGPDGARTAPLSAPGVLTREGPAMASGAHVVAAVAALLPDQMCDNASCGRPYHRTCLVEWLRSVTSTRQSFDMLFGVCPYCSHPITVRASAS
eukprot:jgi/Mesvir1/17277/Mv07684-RA.1